MVMSWTLSTLADTYARHPHLQNSRYYFLNNSIKMNEMKVAVENNPVDVPRKK